MSGQVRYLLTAPSENSMLNPRSTLFAFLVLLSGAIAADLPEKLAKRLDSADAAYNAAVQKADNVRSYAVQKAAKERLKTLKTALTDATKSGDFDLATEIKARVAVAETSGGVRPKPKNVVKFGGHEYALIEEKASWHVAKRICQEMGGHLAMLESTAETKYLGDLCSRAGQSAWIGALNEEGTWLWPNGEKVTSTEGWKLNNAETQALAMTFWQPEGVLDDWPASHKLTFICEWE